MESFPRHFVNSGNIRILISFVQNVNGQKIIRYALYTVTRNYLNERHECVEDWGQ